MTGMARAPRLQKRQIVAEARPSVGAMEPGYTTSMTDPTNQPNRHAEFERERGVHSVDVTASVAHVAAAVGAEENQPARIQAMFRVLADASVPVFFVKLHGQDVTFCVEADRLDDVERVLEGAGFACRTRRDLAIVTVHAGTMRDLIGIMVRIADALQMAQARMYAVGDSHSSVQCLIDGDRTTAAVKQLKAAFGLEAAGE